MAYFGGGSRFAGDPGFFGSLFKGATSIARRAFRATPIGAVVSQLPTFQRPAGRSVPSIALAQRPGTGMVRIGADGLPMKRRRRMNVGNTKALRRAIRRTDGFVRIARSALKNTGFKVVSKSAGKVSPATLRKAVAAAHHAK